MSETTAAPAAVASDAGAAAPVSEPAAPAVDTQVSTDDGNAPVASEATQTSLPASPQKFRFLNREFDDQKKAEEILGAEVGRIRGLQRQTSEFQKTIEGQTAELQALRQLLTQLQGGGNGQGPKGPASPDPQALQDQFGFYEDLANDPNIGVKGALYALQEDLNKSWDERFKTIEQRVDERFSAAEMRTNYEHSLAKTLTAAGTLTSEFPELDRTNQSEQAQEAQMAVLEILQGLPQVPMQNGQMVSMGSVWLATNPEAALRWAATEYRRSHGTPVFAQVPGTSGSPSSAAARAAEAAAAATISQPPDGNGVPRSRPDGKPMNLADRWRTEKPPREATTASGRPLGFPEL